jgi:hypothetical protein
VQAVQLTQNAISPSRIRGFFLRPKLKKISSEKNIKIYVMQKKEKKKEERAMFTHHSYCHALIS